MKPIAFPLALFLLQGCIIARAPEYRGECAAADSRAWQLAELPYAEAMEIREVARSHPIPGALKIGSYSVESWFALPEDKILYCRSDGPLHRAIGGEWWQLERRGDIWSVVDSDCWGCTVVTS
jgi:hypothetical protein